MPRGTILHSCCRYNRSKSHPVYINNIVVSNLCKQIINGKESQVYLVVDGTHSCDVLFDDNVDGSAVARLVSVTALTCNTSSS